jgi:hypothetical protein
MANLSEDDLEKAYGRYFQDMLWGVRSARIQHGTIEVEQYAGIPHAHPQYIATMQFVWKGQKFVLVKKPQRRINP